MGKSSLLNLITGQDVAITSPVPGTTTDVVEKAMELLPLGPVLFLDTAGLDDRSVLAEQRLKRTRKVFDRADVALLVTEADGWTDFEDAIAGEAARRSIPVIIIINKTDATPPSAAFLDRVRSKTSWVIPLSCRAVEGRDAAVNTLKDYLIEASPEDFMHPPSLIGDLLTPGGFAVLVVPIDLQAPRGRLILPQVQTVRDALDNDAAAVVVKEREYAAMLEMLRRPPDIAICDSQVVLKMTADTPPSVPCTTFSILFSRSRGDLVEAARGAAAIPSLKEGDRVLIAEACTHHAMEDDIGRVKIPRWIRQYKGFDLTFDVASGSDYPDDLKDYKLIIHCGGCMINRRFMLTRVQKAREAGVPMTNYGVCISYLQGVLERVLSPFPAALDAHKQTNRSE